MENEKFLNQCVTASELAEFVYCKRAWWLRQRGQLGENELMRSGAQAHDTIFRFISRIRMAEGIVRVLLAIVGIILVLLILYLLFFFP